MGKISIQDLAQVLVERKGLNKRDAAIFVSAMFDIIQTNLEKDRVVKIKGLGTFKIIDVDDRESVNVNTGERVLIEGHNKITFTPDSLMKELVNKPFSQFETVVLNDGVDFEDMNAVPEPTVDDNDPNDPSNMPLVDFGANEEHKLIDIANEENPEWVIEPVVKAPERPAVTEPEIITLGEVPKPEPEQEPDPIVESEPEPIVEESEPESVVELETESIVEPETVSIVESEIETISEPQSGSVFEEPAPEPESEAEEPEPDEVFEEPSSDNDHKWLIPLLACLLGLVGGYVLGNFFPWSQSSQSQEVRIGKEVPVSKAAPMAESVDSVVPTDTIAPASVAVPAAKPTETKPALAAKPEEKTEPVVQLDKYQKMDNRVRYGAYRIVGTAQEIKVKGGDNLKKIASRTLGPDMECYIEVYNDINSKTELKVGQTIKIPKLELKKKKSQK